MNHETLGYDGEGVWAGEGVGWGHQQVNGAQPNMEGRSRELGCRRPQVAGP